MRSDFFNGLLLAAAVVVAAPAQAAVFVFGDSLSDAGNVYDASIALGLQPDPIVPPYYKGRMSNGKNWADLVAEGLGTGETKASRLGGRNYAWAGARSGAGTTMRPSIVHPGQVQPVDNVGKQIQSFAADHPGGFAGHDVALLWSGANDILYYTLGAVPPPAAVSDLVSLTMANLLALESLGARTIVLPNQIDSGKAPIWNGNFGLPPAAKPYITAVTVNFNLALPALVAALEATPGFDADIVLVDAYAAAEAALADPAAFGLTNVTDPAFPANIPGAGTYLFWDPIHPTTAGHGLIAAAALAAIPEPGVLPLLAMSLGLFALAGAARRRSAR